MSLRSCDACDMHRCQPFTPLLDAESPVGVSQHSELWAHVSTESCRNRSRKFLRPETPYSTQRPSRSPTPSRRQKEADK